MKWIARKSNWVLPWLCALPFLLSGVGCSNIPSESVELSQTLGQEIRALQMAHEAAIHSFFEAKRDKARQFLEEEWIPTYAEHYLSDPRISGVMQQTCGAGNKGDCLTAMIHISKAAQIDIQKEYRKILDPLDETEQAMLQAVRQSYSQAMVTNQAITDLLASAAKVQQERQALLQKVGINEAALQSNLAAVSDQVDSLTQDATKLDEKVTSFAEGLQKIREKISTPSQGGN